MVFLWFSYGHRGEDEDLLREALRWNPFALRFASPALANRKAAVATDWRSGGEMVEKTWGNH